MPADREMTLNDNIFKYMTYYLHHLHDHIFHNLTNITIFGKNLFLAVTDLLIRIIPP